MIQWLRTHLPMQGTRVQSLVRELRSHMVQGNRACTAQRARALTREACVLQQRPNTARIKNKWKDSRMKPHSCTNKTDNKHLKTQRHTGSKLEEMTQSRKKQSLHATAKSLQSCPTRCDPIDSSPPGFPVPGILQARTLEWVAISSSNAWKWKVKVKSLSRVRL